MRPDLAKDTTYMDALRRAAGKDRSYENCLTKFRQSGKYSTRLGLTEVLEKNKGEVGWQNYNKTIFKA